MSYAPRAAARQPNLYEYLQVSPRADGVVIQAAYRALARHYHPDVSASANAQRIMREINAAYHVLNDPARRARYDAFRERYHRPPVRRSVERSTGAVGTHVRHGGGAHEFVGVVRRCHEHARRRRPGAG